MLTGTRVLSGLTPDVEEEGRPQWTHPFLSLWGAVFSRAIEDWFEGCRRGYHRGENIPTRIGRRGVTFTHEDFKSAQRWLYADDAHPGSFLWVCDMLGLDSEMVRSQLGKASVYRELKRRVQ